MNTKSDSSQNQPSPLLAAERRRAQPRPIDLACASGHRVRQSRGSHCFWYDPSCSRSDVTARPLRSPHLDPYSFSSYNSAIALKSLVRVTTERAEIHTSEPDVRAAPDDDVLFLFLQNKNQPKAVYPKGTSHHTRLCRGPDTNCMKK